MREDEATVDYEAPELEELGTVEDYTEGTGLSVILNIN
jgi:hypothetical protein